MIRTTKVVMCLVSALMAGSIAVRSLHADEDELPSIRQDESLLHYLQKIQDVDTKQPPYLALDLSEPFDTISVDVAGLESVASLKLITWPDDAEAMSEFSRNVVRARLKELGVEREFAVTERPKPVRSSVPNCKELRISLEFTATRLDSSIGSRLIAALTVISWQAPEFFESNGNPTCAPGNVPPLMKVEKPRLFEFVVGDSNAVKTTIRRQILRAVDTTVLPKVITMSERARQAIDSW